MGLKVKLMRKTIIIAIILELMLVGFLTLGKKTVFVNRDEIFPNTPAQPQTYEPGEIIPRDFSGPEPVTLQFETVGSCYSAAPLSLFDSELKEWNENCGVIFEERWGLSFKYNPILTVSLSLIIPLVLSGVFLHRLGYISKLNQLSTTKKLVATLLIVELAVLGFLFVDKQWQRTNPDDEAVNKCLDMYEHTLVLIECGDTYGHKWVLANKYPSFGYHVAAMIPTLIIGALALRAIKPHQ